MSDEAADHLRLRADKTVAGLRGTARAHNRVTRDGAVRNVAFHAMVMPNSGVVAPRGYPPIHVSQWPVTTATTPSTTSGRVEESRTQPSGKRSRPDGAPISPTCSSCHAAGVLTAKIAANYSLAEVAAAIGHE